MEPVADAPLAIEALPKDPAGRLHWRRVVHEKRNFTLRDDHRLYAGLRFEKSSGSSATADLAGGRFTFKRTGVFRVRIALRRAGAAEELATFVPDWSGTGALSFAGGPSFRWQTRSLLSSVFQWVDAAGVVLMELTPLPGGRSEADLVLAPAAATTAETPLLVAFGFYLGVLAMDELIAVTAAVPG